MIYRGNFTSLRRNEFLASNTFLVSCLISKVHNKSGSGVQLFVLDSYLNSRQGRVLSNGNRNRFKKSLRTVEMTTRSQGNEPSQQLVKEPYCCGTTTLWTPLPRPAHSLPFDPPPHGRSQKTLSHICSQLVLWAWNLGSPNHTHTWDVKPEMSYMTRQEMQKSHLLIDWLIDW